MKRGGMPRDAAIWPYIVTALQTIIRERDTRTVDGRRGMVVLRYFGSGDGAPAYRVMGGG